MKLMPQSPTSVSTFNTCLSDIQAEVLLQRRVMFQSTTEAWYTLAQAIGRKA